MKKLILAVALLLGSLAYAKQYVDYKIWLVKASVTYTTAKACQDLIDKGFAIVSVAMYANGYVIVYEDNEQ